MKLLLLCAGAGDKSWNGPDNNRPLRTKGKRHAQKIGAWMGRNGLRPEIVLTASGQRSRVTTEKAVKAAGWTAEGIRLSGELSEGRLPALQGAQRTLLTAPSRSLETVAGHLGLSLKTRSGVLAITSIENGRASLRERIDPRDLPDLFPYPSPDGSELRPRPAYYYTQSAVIPYRKTETGPEILIVGSSSGRHWVVPKGIVEPGLGPARSALIEAREEAGVEGLASDGPVGHYDYDKWGATCEVAVYTMEVTRILSGDEWEESHRDRRWVSPSEAADLLHQPALKEFVERI